DDPMGTAALLRAQDMAARIETDKANVADAQNRLDGANAALLDVSQELTKVRSLALQGANADLTADDFRGLASEVDGLIRRIFSQANAAIDGRYLFGGTATDAAPFVATRDGQGRITAVTYQGSPTDATVTIGGQPVSLSRSGERTFTQPGRDVFQ